MSPSSMDRDGSTSVDDHAAPYDPTLQLEQDRQRNDLKLKSRFEHIFAKYTKDFSAIGDEIDLETGRIVVDNGHLARMQNERDVGANASSRFVKAFEEELEEESGEGEGEDEDSDEDELARDDHQHVPSSVSRRRSPELASDADDSDGNAADLDESDEDEEGEVRETAFSAPIQHSQSPHATLAQGILNNVPAIQQSLAALAPQPLQPGQQYTVDPVAIQALGQSIANQIAQFLSSVTNSVLQPHHRDPWSIPPLPNDAFSRRPDRTRRLLTPMPQSPTPAFQSPSGGESLWGPTAPHRNRAPRGPYHKRQKQHHPQDDLVGGLIESIEGSAMQETVPKPSFLEDANAAFRMLAHGITENQQEAGSAFRDDSRHVSVAPFGEYLASADEFTDGGQGFSAGYQANRKAPRRFNQQEDDVIKRLRDVSRMSFQDMMARFPGRTASSLQSRYGRLQRKAPIPNHPIIVKREIYEISDDDESHIHVDDLSSYNHRALHPLPPGLSPTRPVRAPLLRQAVGNSMTDRDMSLAPSDYSGYVDDTDYPVEEHLSRHNPWAQAQPLMSSPGQSMYANPYMRPPPQAAYAPSNPFTHYSRGMMLGRAAPAYPQPRSNQQMDPGWAAPPIPPAADDVRPGIEAQMGQGKRRYHGRPENHPRYKTFDTTQGNGTFGMLRTQNLAPYAANPTQQEELGDLTKKSGAFGVLRMGKPKPKKRRRPPKSMKPPKPNSSRRRQSSGSSRREKPGPQEQYHSNVPYRGETPFNMRDGVPPESPLEVNSAQTPYFIDGTPVPLQSRYAATADPLRSPLPHHRDDDLETLSGDSDDGLFMTPRETAEPAAMVQHLGTSSPALPTPPEEGPNKPPFGSVRLTPSRSARSTGSHHSSALKPKPRSVNRSLSRSSPHPRTTVGHESFDSPAHARGTPTQKRPATFEEDSHDELA